MTYEGPRAGFSDTGPSVAELPDLRAEMYHLKRENNPRRRHAMTFSCLGKLAATDATVLARWKRYLALLLEQARTDQAISSFPLVIGLAESGIIPSALLHRLLRDRGIEAEWICSTRRPASGLRFTESHSHGPDHILPLPRHCPTELWFAEDEITTGRTLLNLAVRLCCCLNVRQVRFFAFTDTRSTGLREQFAAILKDHGICFSTHTLMCLAPPEDPLEKAEGPLLCNGQSSLPAHSEVSICTGWHFPEHRPALKSQAEPDFPFEQKPEGTMLAVGEAIDVGLGLIQANTGLSLRHITLSPWEIDRKYIFSRMDICGRYYLYNPHTLRPPLYLLHDPIDEAVGERAAKELARKGLRAEPLMLCRQIS